MDADGLVHPWGDFESAAPSLASVSRERLNAAPNYLATIRSDGSPRVHPVSAEVRSGRLAVYMYPTSPKTKDLERDARYALHCSVANHDGGDGEVHVRGVARLVDEAEHRSLLAGNGFPGMEGYVLFELGVDEVFHCVYVDGDPVIQRWRTSPT